MTPPQAPQMTPPIMNNGPRPPGPPPNNAAPPGPKPPSAPPSSLDSAPAPPFVSPPTVAPSVSNAPSGAVRSGSIHHSDPPPTPWADPNHEIVKLEPTLEKKPSEKAIVEVIKLLAN